MRLKTIPPLISGLALAALAFFSIQQLLAVALLVRSMTNVLEIIGGLF